MGWRTQIDGGKRRCMMAALVGMVAAAAASGAARAQDVADVAGGLRDAIVGTWVGTGSHAGRDDQFNMRLTFVSPKGGVSRYLDVPCGGVLVGGRKGDTYEYRETITFNGSEERSDNFCVSGLVRLSVDGSTMKYDWSPNSAGEELSASGTLKRVGPR